MDLKLPSMRQASFDLVLLNQESHSNGTSVYAIEVIKKKKVFLSSMNLQQLFIKMFQYDWLQSILV